MQLQSLCNLATCDLIHDSSRTPSPSPSPAKVGVSWIGLSLPLGLAWIGFISLAPSQGQPNQAQPVEAEPGKPSQPSQASCAKTTYVGSALPRGSPYVLSRPSARAPLPLTLCARMATAVMLTPSTWARKRSPPPPYSFLMARTHNLSLRTYPLHAARPPNHKEHGSA